MNLYAPLDLTDPRIDAILHLLTVEDGNSPLKFVRCRIDDSNLIQKNDGKGAVVGTLRYYKTRGGCEVNDWVATGAEHDRCASDSRDDCLRFIVASNLRTYDVVKDLFKL